MALAVPQTAASRLSKHALPFARQQIPSSELLAPINLQDKDQVSFPEFQSWFGLDTHLLQALMTPHEDMFTCLCPR